MRPTLSLAALVLGALSLACGSSADAPEEEPATAGDEGEPADAPLPGTETADRAAMSAEECEAQGGTVVGDIGDGAIHRPGYRCPNGEPPIADVPLGVEGSVCCPGDPASSPAAEATADRWHCEGSLDPSAARAVLSRANERIQGCYERRLKTDPEARGRLTLMLQVGEDGSVTAVRTEGELRDPELFACVRGVAEGLSFPIPEGGECAVVGAPFRFTPQP